MQEGGSAAQIPQDEQWLFDLLGFVAGEEDVIQKKTDPVDELSDRPDAIKEEQENDSFSGEMSGGIF